MSTFLGRVTNGWMGQGGRPNGVDQSNNAGNGNTTDDKNNTQNNVETSINPWETPQSNDPSTQQPPINVTVQTPEQKPTSQQVFDQYFNNLRLHDGIDYAKMQQDFMNGDTTSFVAGMNSVMKRMYQDIAERMQSYVSRRLEDASKDILTNARSSFEGTTAVSAMQSQLEYTKKPGIAPIAKAALARFMDQGMDQETAIQKVGQFFEDIMGEVNPAAKNFRTQPGGNPRDVQFAGRDPNVSYTREGKTMDWFEVLGVPKQ